MWRWDGGRASRSFGRDYPTPDGTCVRDYIHVRDLADAHLLALGGLSEAKGRLIYNIGNGQGFTVLEVIESVRRVTGRPIAGGGMLRAGPGDPAVLVASSEKIKTELGWKPRFAELDQIIAQRLGVAPAALSKRTSLKDPHFVTAIEQNSGERKRSNGIQHHVAATQFGFDPAGRRGSFPLPPGLPRKPT